MEEEAVDLSMQPPLPTKRVLAVVNNFVVSTTRFLNHFAGLAEDRLEQVSKDVTRLETVLSILEKKLESVPELATIAAARAAPDIPAEEPPAAAAATEPAAAAAPTGPTNRTNPEYYKWFKMVDMGIPDIVVRQKMGLAGVDPTILDNPDGNGPGGAAAAAPATAAAPAAAPAPAPAAPAGPKYRDHPDYKKWFKMLDMGVPAVAVRQKMQLSGVDQSVLDKGDEVVPGGGAAAAAPAEEEKAAPAPAPEAAAGTGGGASGGLTLKDDPIYSPFFKMLQMGIPLMVVQQKITLAGHDPAILDRDPNSPSPNAGGLVPTETS